ncbi:MAG: hypothetical protein WED33_00650, partial [Bacteroidia bacterium]
MKKIIPCVLAVLYFVNTIGAQSPVFTIGEGNATTDFIPQDLVGETDSEYLVLSWVFGLTLSSALSNSVSSIKDLKMAYMDKTTLNKTKLLRFPEFQGESITKTGKVILEAIEMKGDTLNMFTSAWDKELKDYAVHVWPLNANTLEPLIPKAKLLARIEDNGRDDMKRVEIEYLDFIDQFAIIYSEYSKKTKETKIHVLRLDAKLKPISNEVMAMQGTKHGVGIKD